MSKSHLILMRWSSVLFLRLMTGTLFQSQVSSMPFIASRSVQDQPCELEKSVERTILEGWSVPAVGLGMFLLVVVSGVLSGLTLGLMSIDITRLHVLAVSGTPKQRRMANTILPVKKYPYFLLCSLLIASVLVTEMLPIMNTKLFGESYKALFISAALIIVFGEIIPQAVFPRYALELGSSLIWIVYLCMVICCVPAAILSGAIYYILRGYGSTQTMFSAEELITFIDLHSEDHMDGNGGTLESRTVALIRNIVEAQEKVVGDVTKSLDNVYMVDGELELNKIQLQKILSWGFSKIPVYETCTDVYEDSGLPKMRFFGYIQIRKLFHLDLDLTKNVRSIGLTPLPIIDKDRPLYDALAILRSGNSRMALVADPTRELQTEIESIQRFYHGQYANPRIQLEVGMGNSTLRYLQNDLLWSNQPQARQKEIMGIVTMQDIMRALLEKPVVNNGVKSSRFRRPSLSIFDKHYNLSSSSVISCTPSQDERMRPFSGLDVNIFEARKSRLSLGSTWKALAEDHSPEIHEITQIDGAENEEALELEAKTAVGRGVGTLARRFSFEDEVDEKEANLLKTSEFD